MVTALHINWRLISRDPKVPISGFDTGRSIEGVVVEGVVDFIVDVVLGGPISFTT